MFFSQNVYYAVLVLFRMSSPLFEVMWHGRHVNMTGVVAAPPGAAGVHSLTTCNEQNCTLSNCEIHFGGRRQCELEKRTMNRVSGQVRQATRGAVGVDKGITVRECSTLRQGGVDDVLSTHV